MGAEPPVIGPRGGGEETLVAGMVLSVQAWVSEEGVGGVLLRDAVHVVDGTPQVLSRYRSTLD
jgi:Xaa-Pro aminopeptidase